MANRITAELCLDPDRGKPGILKAKATARSVRRGAATSQIEYAGTCAERINLAVRGSDPAREFKYLTNI